MSGLKSKVDKLDNSKSETTLVNLSKLSDLVKMKLLKRLYIYKKYINITDTSNFN